MSQFRRRASLTIEFAERTLDLSELRFSFRTTQSDFLTPNSATIRVYNLAEQTRLAVESLTEFKTVRLSAGYEGESQFGEIFSGTVKQTRHGRELGKGNVNSFVDILAADGDIALDSGFAMGSKQANETTARQQIDALAADMGVEVGYVMDLPPGALSRGKVQYGLARDILRNLGATHNARASIQKGKLQLVPLGGFIPTTVAEVVVLNSKTGMVGIPEVTQDGVKTKALLNPNITVSGVVQINNEDVKDLLLSGNILYVDQRLETLPGLKPIVAPGDGYYKVLVCEHVGDTRGNDWYTEITGLALTAAPSAGGEVSPNAGR